MYFSSIKATLDSSQRRRRHVDQSQSTVEGNASTIHETKQQTTYAEVDYEQERKTTVVVTQVCTV